MNARQSKKILIACITRLLYLFVGTGLLNPVSGAQNGAPLMTLNSGWNLIGNGTTTAVTVATNLTLNNSTYVRSIWKWDAANSAWAFYSPTLADGGQSYASLQGYQFLKTINPGDGYWINAIQPFSIPVTTSSSFGYSNFMPTSPTALISGWNLISIGDGISAAAFNTNVSGAQSFGGTTSNGLTSLWSWDSKNSLWYFYSPSLDANKTLQSYLTAQKYEDFQSNNVLLKDGVGFWVNNPATGLTALKVTLSGLSSGNAITLTNGAQTQSLSSNGTFSFTVNSNSSYNVLVSAQPTGQSCTVANGAGSASGPVNNIAVSCTMINASYQTADMFVNDLSTTSQTYAAFLNNFGATGKSLVNLSDINLRMFGYLIDSINTLCVKSTGVCLTGSPITYTKNYGFGYTYYFSGDPIGAGYSVSLVKGSDSTTYNYTIANNVNTYTGTLSYVTTSAGTTISLNGNVPNLVNINGQVSTQNTAISIAMSTNEISPLISSTLTGSLTFTASAAATSTLPAFSFALTNGTATGQVIKGDPSYGGCTASFNNAPPNCYTVYKPYSVAPSTLSANLSLTVGPSSALNTFTGTLSATGSYSQPSISPTAAASATTTNVYIPGTATLSGQVTLSNGDSATGSIALTSDYSKVNTTQPQNSTNYALGSISIDLAGFDSTKTNYVEAVLVDQRSSYTNSNLSAQIYYNSAKTNWIELTSSYTLDPKQCSTYEWLCFVPASTNAASNSIAITSSGGFNGAYSVSGKSASIYDSNSNLVGKIINGQLYMNGGVSLIGFSPSN
jgi:hypothetical protein